MTTEANNSAHVQIANVLINTYHHANALNQDLHLFQLTSTALSLFNPSFVTLPAVLIFIYWIICVWIVAVLAITVRVHQQWNQIFFCLTLPIPFVLRCRFIRVECVCLHFLSVHEVSIYTNKLDWEKTSGSLFWVIGDGWCKTWFSYLFFFAFYSAKWIPSVCVRRWGYAHENSWEKQDENGVDEPFTSNSADAAE